MLQENISVKNKYCFYNNAYINNLSWPSKLGKIKKKLIKLVSQECENKEGKNF